MEMEKFLNQLNDYTTLSKNTAIIVNNLTGLNELKRNTINKFIGKCRYCDPMYSYISNFAEACKGYDVPMGNPNPGNINVNLLFVLRITFFI